MKKAIKRKWPKAAIEFGIPVYSGRVYIYRKSEHVHQAREYLAGKTLDDAHRYARGGCTAEERDPKTGEAIYIVGWFQRHRPILIHELAHVCDFRLVSCGVTDSSAEAFCYLLQWLCELTEVF